MMVARHVCLRIMLALSCASGVIGLGWALGSSYGRSAAIRDRARTAAEAQQSQGVEAARIDSGEFIPSFGVQSAGTSRAELNTRLMLPNGGLLVVASASCPACLGVVDAIGLARSIVGTPPCPMALVLEGAVPDSEVTYLANSYSDMGVFVDDAETLVRTYGVLENPSYFVLNSAGRVVHTGFGLRTPEEFAQLIKQYCSPGNR